MTTPDIEAAGLPELLADYERRNQCEQCDREMHGENAVCLTCWNRVASKVADCERLLRERPQIRLVGTQVKAAVNECSDMHGIGPDFPVTWLDTNMDFNALAKALNERLRPPAVSEG